MRVDTYLTYFMTDKRICRRPIKAPRYYFEQNFFLYANDMVEFFEALAESGIDFACAGSQDSANSQNVFMIQLPKRDAAEHALEIIKSQLEKAELIILL